MKKWLGLAAAAAAFAFLAMLAFHGQRPEPGLSDFKVAGVMATTDPAKVNEVTVGVGGATRQLKRGSPEWQTAGETLERGLKFLHVTAPERQMTLEEVAAVPAADFGLDPPLATLAVRTESGPVLEIAFGKATPLGFARYARVTGRPGIVILPSYVADTWEQVVSGR
jgi:hypothetical protein